ncbi:hypothetical protein JCM3770_004348 [Rhodotorula araucariae]
MSARSFRRSASHADSSDELDHLDSPSRTTGSHHPDDSASESSSSDEDAVPASRKAWDVEQGYGTGRKRWEMRSLPAGVRPTRGAGGAPPLEPGVRASTKTPATRAQGTYAPVAQADPYASSRAPQRGSGVVGAAPSNYADPVHSPPYSDSEVEQHTPPPSGSEDEKPRSTRSSRSSKKAPAATAQDGDEQPQSGKSKKRWIIVGALAVVVLVIVIGVVALIMNSNKRDESNSAGDAAEDNASSSHSKSSTTTASNSKSASMTASTLGYEASETESRSSGPTNSTAAMHADDEMTDGTLSATDDLDSATSLTITTGMNAVAPTSFAAVTTSAAATVASLPPVNAPAQPVGGGATIVITIAQPATTTIWTVPPPANSPSAADQIVGAAGASSDPARHDGGISTIRAPAAAQTGPGSEAGWSGASQTTASPAQNTVTKVSTTATWFGADQHLSACRTTFDDSDFIAAVPPEMFGSDGSVPSKLCGARLRVWQPETNRTVKVTIGDVCNGCPTATSIDLSQAAFLRLAPGGSDDPAAALELGVLAVQWFFDDPRAQALLGTGFEEWGTSGDRA